jgi:hypothetical protein
VSLSQTLLRHYAPSRPNGLRVLTPFARPRIPLPLHARCNHTRREDLEKRLAALEKEVFGSPKQPSASASENALTQDQDERDEWIMKLENERFHAVARMARAKSKHLVALKDYAYVITRVIANRLLTHPYK